MRKLTMTRTIGTAVDRNINIHLGMMMDGGWKLQVEAAKTNTLDAGRDIRGKMTILKAWPSEQTTQIDTDTPSIDTRVDTRATPTSSAIEVVIKRAKETTVSELRNHVVAIYLKYPNILPK